MSLGLGTAVAYLTLDATGFSRGIDMAIADTVKLKTGFSNVDSALATTGARMTGIGTLLTAGITAPIVAFGAASIKSGAEFDTSMSNVKAVSMAAKSDLGAVSEAAKRLGVSYEKGATDGETAFNALRATAIKMGNETRYTAKESADALYYMGLAGWNAEQMINGIPGVLALASAGEADLATTSDIVTDAITGFGHSANETASVLKNGIVEEIPIATRLADIMAATMANSNTDVLQLGEAFKYVSPIAGSFGYSMEDVSLSLGLMANAGVKASQAGTTLRQGLKRLVAPTEKAQVSMEKYGWSAYDAEGKTKPLRQQLEELRGIFGKLDIDVKNADGTLKTSEQIMEEYGQKLPVNDQERLTDAVNIFGTTALPGMLALMNASDESFYDLASAIDTSSGAFDGLGYAQGMAAVQLDNLQGDWILFTSALGTSKQIISDLLNGPLRNLVQGLTNLVRKFNEADPATQKMILKIAGLAAAMGPVLIVGGKLLSWVATVKSGFSSLGSATAQATKAFDKVSDTTGVLANAFVNTGAQKDALLNNFLQVPGATGVAGNGFIGLTTAAGGTGKALTTLSPQIKSISGTEMPRLATASTSVTKSVGGLAAEVIDANGKVLTTTTAFEKAVPAVTGFGKTFSTLKTGVSGAFSALSSYGKAFSTSFAASMAAGEGAIASFGAAFNAMTTAMAANPIGLVVLAIAALVAVIGLVVYHLATEESAIKSVTDAEKDYTSAHEEAVSALKSQGDAVQSLRDAQKSLAEAEQETGESGQALFEQVQNGTKSLYDLSDSQLKIYNLYGSMVEAQKRADEATLQSIDAKHKETMALGELGLAQAKEEGNYESYKESVIRAYQDGSLAAEDASELLSKAMTEMDASTRTAFKENIPDSIKGSLNPATYETDAQYMATQWQSWMALLSGDTETFSDNVQTEFTDAYGNTQMTWGGIAEWFRERWSGVSEGLDTELGDIGGWFEEKKNDVENAWNDISNWFSEIFQDAWNGITGIFQSIGQWFTDRYNDITNAFDNISNWFREKFQQARDFIVGIFQGIGQWFDNRRQDVQNAFNIIADWFREKFQQAYNFITSIFASIGNWFTDRKNDVVGAFNNIADWFNEKFQQAWNFITGIFSAIGGWFIDRKNDVTNAFSNVADWFGGLFQSAYNNIVNKFIYIGGYFQKVWHDIKSAFNISDALNWGSDMINNFINGIKQKWDDLKTAVKGAADIVADYLKHSTPKKGPLSDDDVWTEHMMQNFIDGVNNKKRDLESSVVDVTQMIARNFDDSGKKVNVGTEYYINAILHKTDSAYSGLFNSLKYQLDDINGLLDNKLQEIMKTTDTAQKEELQNQYRFLYACKSNLQNQLSEYGKEYIDFASNQLSNEQKLYDVSTKQIVEYWKDVQSRLQVGTEAWNLAQRKIEEAQINMYANIASEAKTKLAEIKKTEDLTITQEIAFWEIIKKQCITGSKAYNEAVDNITSLNKKLTEEIESANKTLNDGIAKANESLQSKLKSINDAYEKEFESTKDSLMGLSGLFEKFSANSGSSASTLMKNLKSQVQGLENWNGLIDKMYSRKLPNDLIEELEGMGPKASKSIEALLNMSDEELTEYVNLWKQKNEQASKIANKLVDKDSYTKQTQEAIAENKQQINELINTYNQKMTELGQGTIALVGTYSNSLNTAMAAGLQSTSQVFTQTISQVVTGIQEQLPIVKEQAKIVVLPEDLQIDKQGFFEQGQTVMKELLRGINSLWGSVTNRANLLGKTICQQLIAGLNSMRTKVYTSGYTIGKLLDEGMAKGINDYVGSVISAAIAAVQAAVAAARQAAQISSPSRLMASEVGRWLPPGIAEGVEDAMPEAVNDIQTSIDRGLSSLETEPIDMSEMFNVKDIGDELKSALKDILAWFNAVTNEITSMTGEIITQIQDVIDKTDGMVYNINENKPYETLLSGVTSASRQNATVSTQPVVETIENNTTNNFYSPKPIDEVEASRLLRQTSRDLAEGFA